MHASDTITQATDATFGDQVESHPGLAVVDFWASWCAPCRMIAPILDEIAADRAGEVKVVGVDADANPRTASRYGIRSMPTLLFFSGGKPVGQIVGAVPRRVIEDAIDRYRTA